MTVLGSIGYPGTQDSIEITHFIIPVSGTLSHVELWVHIFDTADEAASIFVGHPPSGFQALPDAAPDMSFLDDDEGFVLHHRYEGISKQMGRKHYGKKSIHVNGGQQLLIAFAATGTVESGYMWRAKLTPDRGAPYRRVLRFSDFGSVQDIDLGTVMPGNIQAFEQKISLQPGSIIRLEGQAEATTNPLLQAVRVWILKQDSTLYVDTVTTIGQSYQDAVFESGVSEYDHHDPRLLIDETIGADNLDVHPFEFEVEVPYAVSEGDIIVIGSYELQGTIDDLWMTFTHTGKCTGESNYNYVFVEGEQIQDYSEVLE